MPNSQPRTERGAAHRPLERDILYAMAPWTGDRPRLWSVGELADALEEDALAEPLEELSRVGLVHRTPDGRVFASLAAVHFAELVGHVA